MIELELLTVAELAAAWKVSRGTIYKRVRDEGLPYVEIVGDLRFRPASVATWLEQHERVNPTLAAKADRVAGAALAGLRELESMPRKPSPTSAASFPLRERLQTLKQRAA